MWNLFDFFSDGDNGIDNMDQKRKYKYGFTLGKFMPTHEGHLFLIREALTYVEHLTVLVCTIKREPIDGLLRYKWMKELAPNVNVVHITDEVPSYPHEDPDFWNIWVPLMKRNTHPDTQVFFSAEDYGDEVAKRMNIEHIKIPKARITSGTAIRTDPFSNWNFIPDVVKPYYVKRIVLTGPESTGKTTMAKKLADHFNTFWVEEYGREHFDKVNGKLTLDDISQIAETQVAREDAMAQKANKLLFCDTDLIVTQIWSQIYFKQCPEWIIEASKKRTYHLFLLMDIDGPWVDDGTREFPHLRSFHFNRLRDELDAQRLNYKIISGSYEEKFQKAIDMITGSFLRS